MAIRVKYERVDGKDWISLRIGGYDKVIVLAPLEALKLREELDRAIWAYSDATRKEVARG